MKTILIKLQDKFILVSDEEIKKGDHFWGPAIKEVLFASKEMLSWNSDTTQQHKGWLKIIAGIPELPSIDFSLLSEEDCKSIGYVDVEKLVKDMMGLPNYLPLTSMAPSMKGSYDFGVECFKTCQSLNDKMFSLEDVNRLAKFITNNALTCNNYITKTNQFIQSLQQTSWNVEVEMEDYLTEELALKGSFKNLRPKITNNSIRIVKIL